MTRITYLRNDSGLPVVCLAFDHEKGGDTIKYQMAVHNPKDKCVKKLAVALATERLEKQPIEISLPSDLDNFDVNLLTLCKNAIVVDILYRANVPKRAVKVAESWDPFAKRNEREQDRDD